MQINDRNVVPRMQRSEGGIFAPGTSAAVVRYHVRDVERAAEFYVDHLGFRRTHAAGPIAVLARGDLNLLLSGPTASGSRALPDGRRQESGGWNRIVVYVDSLDESIAELNAAGAHFLNELQSGPGGRQILLADLDGNPIELHEAPAG